MRFRSLSLWIASFSLACSPCLAGNISGGGGDAVALEFTSYAKSVARELQGPALRWPGDVPKIELPGVDAIGFDTMVNNVRVNSIEKAVLSGVEVDAINYPS